ncbi:hypothetical protein LXL04_012468 [Taraxacum kok-saghyz]
MYCYNPHGIFHLSDPSGVNLIRNCDERGFHPHEEPDDGSPIYEHCSHVYINETLRFGSAGATAGSVAGEERGSPEKKNEVGGADGRELAAAGSSIQGYRNCMPVR